jgi:hypothetical protein
MADIPGRDHRKLLLSERLLLSLVGQRIRTLCKLHRKLLRPPFSFQNCTKMTKYEALEKNVVSNRKLSSLRQSLVRSVSQKVSVCWGFWGWSTELDSRLPWLMAEGEELGSNLLHGAHSSLWGSGGSGSFGRGRKPLTEAYTALCAPQKLDPKFIAVTAPDRLCSRAVNMPVFRVQAKPLAICRPERQSPRSDAEAKPSGLIE